MAAIIMLLSITLAFDIARLMAARAAGMDEDLDDEDDYCAGCCGRDKNKVEIEDDDEGCAKEFFGCSEDGKCAECCQSDDDSDDE